MLNCLSLHKYVVNIHVNATGLSETSTKSVLTTLFVSNVNESTF